MSAMIATKVSSPWTHGWPLVSRWVTFGVTDSELNTGGRSRGGGGGPVVGGGGGGFVGDFVGVGGPAVVGVGVGDGLGDADGDADGESDGESDGGSDGLGDPLGVPSGTGRATPSPQ